MRYFCVKSSLRHIIPPLLVLFVLAQTSCSTQQNTAKTRFWHAFNAKYNIYYNGSLAYIDGSLEKEEGNKDNYTELIPLYYVGNKNSIELGKGNFDRAIEKSQKAIQRHSIKRKPQWTKSRKKTERDREWLSRKEYNQFLWKAWMLMGRSQFHKGAFDDAAATFSYMSRLYEHQPAIYGKARAWLAKAYIEEGWLYDAEDVIRNIRRDSLDWRAVKEWDYTYADYYIHTAEYDKAIPYLRKVIKHEMRRKQRAREWYLLGQLYSAAGNRQEAYNAFKRVIRQNPPYELEFNARIAMTEVMAQGNSKQMLARLRRMAASDKNKEYLEQVYYAIGNIHLAQRDTTQAIAAYEKGNEKATRSGIEKGVLLLQLGNLYWQKEKYGDAKRCYGEAIGLLDKDRKDYEELSKRSVVLDELVPYTDAVQLQDSLQQLARMSETDRNAAIDRVIEALKRKEKEERHAREAAEAETLQQQNSAKYGSNQSNKTSTATPTTTGGNSSTWYFYNPMAVSQGKQTFQRQWGKRENVDNWQRVNTTVVGNFTFDQELTDEQRDSIATVEARQDSIENRLDSAQNNPHRREYYLAQIPFTPEQLNESNHIIENGLFNAGVIFKDKLDNLRQSERYLLRLTTQYPDNIKQDEAYYHLFLLYSRLGQTAKADSYIDRLKREYAPSLWTTLLTDPYFEENARFGTHIEDSLYAATYEAFKTDRFSEVAGNVHVSETRFPQGANRDKFLFIGGLSKLNSGNASGCVKDMETVVEQFPDSRISEMAGMIVNGVKAGKRLHGARFDLGDVWSRRAAVMSDSDSIATRTFTDERITPFTVMLVYAPDSVNENQLLFEMARFNFTNFIVRNFEIAIDDDEGLHRMRVSGFRSYDEARQYARQMHSNAAVMRQSQQTKTYIISDTNLDMLGQQYSYKDYDDFYSAHFAPLKVSTLPLLTEPDEINIREERTTLPGNLTDDEQQTEESETGTAVDEQQDNAQEPADDGGIIINDTPDEQPTEQTDSVNRRVSPVKNAEDAPQSTPVQPVKDTSTERKAEPTEKKAVPTTTPAVPQPQPTPPVEEEKEEDEGNDDEYFDFEGF